MGFFDFLTKWFHKKKKEETIVESRSEDKPNNEENLSIAVTEEDSSKSWQDDAGVTYNLGGSKLLKGNWNGSSSNVYEIKSGTKSICDKAFYSCSSPKKLILPNSLRNIGEEVFAYSGLEEVVSNSANFVAEDGGLYYKKEGKLSLIYYFGNQTSVTIPERVFAIRSWAFEGRDEIKKVILPYNLSSLAEGIFQRCGNLEGITLPDSIKTIRYATFRDCTSLKEIVLPDEVQSIEDFAFQGCESLCRIYLGENVKHIGRSAFYECKSLSAIEMPDNIDFIGENAFLGCTSLVLYVSAGKLSYFQNLLKGQSDSVRIVER